MILIFRKLRQKLLASNRFTKYTLYAIGEIFLVVIGILIALQVNNWNEERKSRTEAAEFRRALNDEFTNNRTVLNDRITYLEDANEHVRSILSFFNMDNNEIQNINVDSVISKSLMYGNYNPANSTIQELISSGKLNLVTDDSLKINLFNWLQLLEDTDEDFKNQDLQAITMLLEPYLYKYISLKNFTSYSNYDLKVSGKSYLFDGDYSSIFNDMEFENLYHGKLFWNTVMINHYKELDALAIEIIRQTR